MKRVTGVLLGLLLAVGLLATASPAGAVPLPAGRVFAGPVDAASAYVPQTTCQPVARPGVLKFKSLVLSTYPGTGTLGIVAACGTDGKVSEHYEGRAWDWQVSTANATQKAEADAFLSWLLATDRYGNKYAMARRLGVMYVIWNARIWGIYRASEGWRPYSCSGTTGCHKDHVHFSFSWAGALAKTSYWSGTPVTGNVPAPKPPTTAPKPPAPAPAPTPAPKPPTTSPRPGPVPTPPSDRPVVPPSGHGPYDPPARGEPGDHDDHPDRGRHHGGGHHHRGHRGHR